ncbi:hypothetical protein D9757_010775 [Collybiopsis confluens]|uniref:Uncharacterized protein n=1 Tax=Collybiopsis confluens TaxID=2823264 RepID=A0A8H5H8M1_9AGAR|nr:hypothetical protein D9757_010775 [Collybiopsis confluens]
MLLLAYDLRVGRLPFRDSHPILAFSFSSPPHSPVYLLTVPETVRSQVAPQVGKAVQDPLKFLDETDLGIVNHIGMDGSAGFQVEISMLWDRLGQIETEAERLKEEKRSLAAELQVRTQALDIASDRVKGLTEENKAYQQKVESLDHEFSTTSEKFRSSGVLFNRNVLPFQETTLITKSEGYGENI